MTLHGDGSVRVASRVAAIVVALAALSASAAPPTDIETYSLFAIEFLRTKGIKIDKGNIGGERRHPAPFLAGLAFQVPSNFPGGINPVSWSVSFSSDTTVNVNWQWAAAVYTSFSSSYNALGVKPVDDNMASIYQNSDHAGTPENFKAFVTGGARGGGGSNFTGSYTGTASATCTCS